MQGKGGLVLIMHACEMADGNVWEKKIAKLAIERLGPADEFGVIDCDWQQVAHPAAGDRRQPRQAAGPVDKLMPGDMPTSTPA